MMLKKITDFGVSLSTTTLYYLGHPPPPLPSHLIVFLISISCPRRVTALIREDEMAGKTSPRRMTACSCDEEMDGKTMLKKMTDIGVSLATTTRCINLANPSPPLLSNSIFNSFSWHGGQAHATSPMDTYTISSYYE